MFTREDPCSFLIASSETNFIPSDEPLIKFVSFPKKKLLVNISTDEPLNVASPVTIFRLPFEPLMKLLLSPSKNLGAPILTLLPLISTFEEFIFTPSVLLIFIKSGISFF